MVSCHMHFGLDKIMRVPQIQLRQVIESWLKVDCFSKLKPLFNAVPGFIILFICKRINVIRNCGSMSKHALVLCANRMIFLLSKVRYPWLNEIPNTLPLVIKQLEEYAHLNCCKIKTWKLHSLGSIKCKTYRCIQLENPCLGALT